MTTTIRSFATLRNIGISAHVDAGKTTLTERILFYAGRIHRIGEVHDRDGKGATMDSTKAEKAHGITIRSAATRVQWQDHVVTIIDTPGHVDFTIEVERSLRVLDGAVFVLSAVEGVQAQSFTVDRQMRRYGVPRIAFINKMDRVGANPDAVVRDLREALGIRAAPIQLPLGAESTFDGVVDLVEMRTLRFTGALGEHVVLEDVPASVRSAAQAARERLVDLVSRHDEPLLEAALQHPDVPPPILRDAIRRATLGHGLVPVLFGSAFRNIGVQPVLDAVVAYLPDPSEVRNVAQRPTKEGMVEVELDPHEPTPCAFVFKLDESRFGALAYVRIYQGRLEQGMSVFGSRTGRRIRIGRLLHLHPGDPTPVDSAEAGEIVGLFGADVESGDTLCGPDPTTGRSLGWRLTSFEVPEPVVSRTIEPQLDADLDTMAKALVRFAREDPSLRVGTDSESGQTLISGTGLLQLELYAERLADEYGVGVRLGSPQVGYRETIASVVSFDHLHRKQSGGGSGQYARVVGQVRPIPELDPPYRFAERIRGGAIPREYLAACEEGFREALQAGPLLGAPVMGIEVELLDGATHVQDSSALAFQIAARDALRAALAQAVPRLLEPVMRVEIEGPQSCFGTIGTSLVRRRGEILGSTVRDGRVEVVGRVPLAEMFDYAADLGGLTSGRGSHSMGFDGYAEVPAHIADRLRTRHRS